MSAYVFVSKMEGPGGFVVDNILVSMVWKVYGHILHVERFKSELGLSISVCWVFSVYQVSKLGQEKKYVRNY